MNKGSQFCFTIPYNSVYQEEDSSEFSIDSVDLHDKTILIAEDDLSSYKLLEGYLKPSSANLLYAPNGVEAMTIFLSNQSIDLILLDIKMPLLNGIDTAKEIRKIDKKIPIIAQTAFAMVEDKENALAAGCNYYITKPISKHQLYEILKTIFS